MAALDISLLGLATAAIAGAISFLSPCVLPLVPGYLSYVAGGAVATNSSDAVSRLRVFRPALLFVLGFTTVFVLLGVSAMALGGVLQRFQTETNLIGGALVVVFGLAMTGLLRLPVLMADHRWNGPRQVNGPVGAFLLGVAFAFGWTPCIGPVLGSILTVTATSSGNGALLLGVYGLGLGVPFLLTALFMGNAAAALKRMRRIGAALNIGGGAVMIGVGFLMMTGRMQEIAIWILTTFPALGAIG
ncbi:cytochrome c biogenesis protein CcdA [Xanthobacter autotrophicus]|jgi:cytochrome c-type biogenesis protein|uniref:cytochrome c biogenesis CcdA family protein n=1 Tax=Xanthobacter autotrophicus TaxID=280 RepID=UPI001E47C8CC|nr:cytochrome c biogenesis protein CcdA [Xanthobacter autotrophicus]UDQ88490.1 cytochrome c biogenesis protein CcdA [Xanthobacter autotrophicus]